MGRDSLRHEQWPTSGQRDIRGRPLLGLLQNFFFFSEFNCRFFFFPELKEICEELLSMPVSFRGGCMTMGCLAVATTAILWLWGDTANMSRVSERKYMERTWVIDKVVESWTNFEITYYQICYAEKEPLVFNPCLARSCSQRQPKGHSNHLPCFMGIAQAGVSKAMADWNQCSGSWPTWK